MRSYFLSHDQMAQSQLKKIRINTAEHIKNLNFWQRPRPLIWNNQFGFEWTAAGDDKINLILKSLTLEQQVQEIRIPFKMDYISQLLGLKQSKSRFDRWKIERILNSYSRVLDQDHQIYLGLQQELPSFVEIEY